MCQKRIKMIFISSQRVHFFTFLSNHRIKKLLYKKSFLLLSNEKICQKRIKNDIHFIKKCSFCHFFLIIKSINFFYKKVAFYLIIKYVIKGSKMTFISSQSVHFVTFFLSIKSKNFLYKKSLYSYQIEKYSKKD